MNVVQWDLYNMHCCEESQSILEGWRCDQFEVGGPEASASASLYSEIRFDVDW